MTQTKVITCIQCSHVFKWIDERLPNYCPECGKPIYNQFLTALNNPKD